MCIQPRKVLRLRRSPACPGPGPSPTSCETCAEAASSRSFASTKGFCRWEQSVSTSSASRNCSLTIQGCAAQGVRYFSDQLPLLRGKSPAHVSAGVNLSHSYSTLPAIGPFTLLKFSCYSGQQPVQSPAAQPAPYAFQSDINVDDEELRHIQQAAALFLSSQQVLQLWYPFMHRCAAICPILVQSSAVQPHLPPASGCLVTALGQPLLRYAQTQNMACAMRCRAPRTQGQW